MTQKELLYFEDAIMHEQNVMQIIDLSITSLENKNLISFMDEQRKVHEKMHKSLLNLLEAKGNE